MTIYSLPQLSVLSIAGKDRQTWLNNLCTQNLKNALPGSSVETFFTNVKGKTIAHGWIVVLAEKLLFVGVPDQAEFLLAHFDRYLFREEVVLERQDENWNWIATDQWSPIKALGDLTDGDAAPSQQALELASGEMLLCQQGLLGPGYWMVGLQVNSPAASRYAANLQADGVEPSMEWQWKRIEAGIPYFGIDFDEQHLPQELGRDAWAISFNKGCYLGQETVARLDALGQVQKKLFRIAIPKSEGCSIESLLAARSILSQGQIVGTCTSLAPVENGVDYCGLAMIKRSHFTTDQAMTLADEPVTCLPIPQPNQHTSK